jgi:2-keto-3-deoxy-L-rhamnonate aldolase RhmA
VTISFKNKLRSEALTCLINVDHPSACLTQFVCGLGGMDAIMIDCEQGNPSFEDVEHLTRAARMKGTAAIVRVPSSEPWTIERYMMRDIDGIVVPRLDTAAQARKAVADIQYAVPREFDKKVVIIQIESASAVAELDDFLAIEEVDCFFIGAVDLSKSMGFAGDYANPTVAKVLDDVIARIRGRHRSVGFLVKPHDTVKWAGKGVNMLYTHVNDFVSMGALEWQQRAGIVTAK